MEIEMGKRKAVYTFNTWDWEKLHKAAEWLEMGYYVHFGATCIGHTRAYLTEMDGIKRMQEKYGDCLDVVYCDNDGEHYCFLKDFREE